MDLMDFIELKIKLDAKAKGITLYDLVKKIGMTEPGFYKMFSLGSIKLKTLKSIADALNKPIGDYFDESKLVIDDKEMKRRQSELIRLNYRVKRLEKVANTQQMIIDKLSGN